MNTESRGKTANTFENKKNNFDKEVTYVISSTINSNKNILFLAKQLNTPESVNNVIKTIFSQIEEEICEKELLILTLMKVDLEEGDDLDKNLVKNRANLFYNLENLITNLNENDDERKNILTNLQISAMVANYKAGFLNTIIRHIDNNKDETEERFGQNFASPRIIYIK